MYMPLPDTLTIRDSDIHGLGLFCVEDIPDNKSLGVTHVRHEYFRDGWVRTPLGGFYNHSDNPNCGKVTSHCGEFMALVTLRPIQAGEEITVSYTLYDVTAPPTIP